MTIYKDQILEPKEFTLAIYTIDNYCNLYLKNFVVDLI